MAVKKNSKQAPSKIEDLFSKFTKLSDEVLMASSARQESFLRLEARINNLSEGHHRFAAELKRLQNPAPAAATSGAPAEREPVWKVEIVGDKLTITGAGPTTKSFRDMRDMYALRWPQ